MFAYWFRHPYITRLRQTLTARRASNPWLRALLWLPTFVILALLLAAGFFLALALLLATYVWRLAFGRTRPAAPRARGRVFEGQYRSSPPGHLPHAP